MLTSDRMQMLEIDSLSLAYGHVVALHEVSLRVEPGEIVALIGSNGAGKSSLLRAISGLVQPSAGSIQYCGSALSKSSAHRRAAAGIAVVPENRRLFGSMSVLDNLLLGAYSRAAFARLSNLKPDLEAVFELFPRLEERQAQQADTLSGGEQQMVAIGRALMSRPKLILLDEPSIGLAPLVVQSIFAVLEVLRAQGRTLLIVEQNAMAALRIADRAYVLDRGRVHLSGPASQLRKMDRIRELYLGGAAA